MANGRGARGGSVEGRGATVAAAREQGRGRGGAVRRRRIRGRLEEDADKRDPLSVRERGDLGGTGWFCGLGCFRRSISLFFCSVFFSFSLLFCF